MIKKAALINIKGRVQGVGFRYFTAKRARSLGLSGYAKNLTDGSVEVLTQGAEVKIKQLISMLELGPQSAKVSDVQVEWSASGLFGRAQDRDCIGFDIY